MTQIKTKICLRCGFQFEGQLNKLYCNDLCANRSRSIRRSRKIAIQRSNDIKALNVEDLEGEIWKDVPGYEGFYMCSNLSRVKSIYREINQIDGSIGQYPSKLISANKCNTGYLRILLSRDNKKKNYFLHRIVALTFIPNHNNKPCVNHINGIKTDNSISNLEWCTHKENTKHGIAHGLISFKNGQDHHCFGRRGALHKSSKEVVMTDRNNTHTVFPSLSDAVRHIGKGSSSGINQAIRRDGTAYGFKWKYN